MQDFRNSLRNWGSRVRIGPGSPLFLFAILPVTWGLVASQSECAIQWRSLSDRASRSRVTICVPRSASSRFSQMIPGCCAAIRRRATAGPSNGLQPEFVEPQHTPLRAKRTRRRMATGYVDGHVTDRLGIESSSMEVNTEARHPRRVDTSGSRERGASEGGPPRRIVGSLERADQSPKSAIAGAM